jgi:hypothetical protein
MPIISTRADIEKAEQGLKAMTDLEVDQAYQKASQMEEAARITLCLLELHRRHLVK